VANNQAKIRVPGQGFLFIGRFSKWSTRATEIGSAVWCPKHHHGVLNIITQTEFRQKLVQPLEIGRQCATAVSAAIFEASGILQARVPGLLATDVVLTDGSSIKFAQQAAALGAKTLMIIGNLSAPAIGL